MSMNLFKKSEPLSGAWTKKEQMTVSENNKDTSRTKICVITLTYNRPDYIERSFESLYKRAGMKIEHYVFDDCSDNETIERLKELKNKYGFNLYINETHLGIYKSFYYNLSTIPSTFDYYVKLDSDVEILSDNMFPLLLEVFSLSNKIGGITPRVEGILNSDRYDSLINFYNGHAIKDRASVVYGCCLVLSKKVFTSFLPLERIEFEETTEKWGIDSKLYEHARRLGDFLIVEDLSVYHIDNTYGQRRLNNNYFTGRKRWKIPDVHEVWFMNVSKTIYPEYIRRGEYELILTVSSGFKDFLRTCKKYLKNKNIIKIKQDKMEGITEIKEKNTKTMYKVTSPINFGTDVNMQHGSFKYFSKIPKWAIDNPNIVTETEEVLVEEDDEETKTKEKTKQKDIKLHISEKSGKIKLKCANCKYHALSKKLLEKHIIKKHS